MEFKDLLEFVEKEDERLKYLNGYQDNEKRILARTVKLTEELGELCNDILSNQSLQRKEKLEKHEKHDKKNINDEFADVIIVTLLLARSMKVDIRKVLEKRLKKINKRYE